MIHKQKKNEVAVEFLVCDEMSFKPLLDGDGTCLYIHSR